jgi:hypothetical protein
MTGRSCWRLDPFQNGQLSARGSRQDGGVNMQEIEQQIVREVSSWPGAARLKS